MNIEYLDFIDSTNSELMRRAATGDYSTICLVAKAQTAGRGRLGRAWLSDEHSLTFSLGLPLAPRDWSGLSLAVGVSIAESLHERIQIKWPNDLWVDGKKLAGILIETAAMRDQAGAPAARYVVVGLGLNVEAPTTDIALGMKTQPSGLRGLLPTLTAKGALALILPQLQMTLNHFEQQGWQPYAERYAARDALQGLSIQLTRGADTVASGQYAGVDTAGALQLQTADGLKSFISHEVSVCF